MAQHLHSQTPLIMGLFSSGGLFLSDKTVKHDRKAQGKDRWSSRKRRFDRMRTRITVHWQAAAWLIVMVSVALFGVPVPTLAGADAPEITGTLGSPDATTTISGKQLPAPESEVRRRDQARGPGIHGVVGASHRPAEESAQHPAHHHGRRRIRSPPRPSAE